MQLAQCRFPGLAINSQFPMLKHYYRPIFQIKQAYMEAIVSDSSRKLMIWDYQNSDCSLRKKHFFCHLLYFSAHFRTLCTTYKVGLQSHVRDKLLRWKPQITSVVGVTRQQRGSIAPCAAGEGAQNRLLLTNKHQSEYNVPPTEGALRGFCPGRRVTTPMNRLRRRDPGR